MPEVSELKTATQTLLKKAGKATAHPTDIMGWFNECLRKLQRFAKVPGIWKVELIADTEAYSLFTGAYPILTLDQVFWIKPGATKGEPLDIVSLRARWQDNTVRFQQAKPDQFSHILSVWPPSLTGTLELHGAARLDTLSRDDDIPQIAEEFHDLLPLFAAGRFGGQDEDFQAGRYGAYMQEYLERKQEFKTAMTSGARGGPRFVQRGV